MNWAWDVVLSSPHLWREGVSVLEVVSCGDLPECLVSLVVSPVRLMWVVGVVVIVGVWLIPVWLILVDLGLVVPLVVMVVVWGGIVHAVVPVEIAVVVGVVFVDEDSRG